MDAVVPPAGDAPPHEDGPGTRPVHAYAHRGGARHPELVGLENTMTAFAHAVALGYRCLETDVHRTRDGVLVAFHDASLDRVTDGVGAIADLSAAEVAAVRVAGRERVPLLVELLDAFDDVRINVDLKGEGTAEALADLLATRPDADRVLVGSFSPRHLRRFRRLAGDRVATSAHVAEVAAYRLLPGRLARVVAPRARALQVPVRRGRLRVLTPALLRRAHAAGLEVHVWTVDEADEMERLLDAGVDGLMTDRTDILGDVLRGRGLWPTT